MCGILKLPVWIFLRRAYTAPFLLCMPLIAVLLGMRLWFYPRTLLQFSAHVLAGGLVYGAFVYYFMFVKGPLNSMNPRRHSENSEDQIEPQQPVSLVYTEEPSA